MAGTRETSVRSYDLYVEGSTLNTNDFADGAIDFVSQDAYATPFVSQGIIITNDNTSGGANIQFSFNGTTVHGTIKPTEIITFDYRRERKIFLRSSAASAFRFWAW